MLKLHDQIDASQEYIRNLNKLVAWQISEHKNNISVELFVSNLQSR